MGQQPRTVYFFAMRNLGKRQCEGSDNYDLDSNVEMGRGRRENAQGDRWREVVVSEGVCRAGASRSFGGVVDCGVAYADSGGAVSRLLHLRGADVAGVAAGAAAARDDRHDRFGDEPVRVLNRVARRVSA